jgi:regulator of replication initiation timing
MVRRHCGIGVDEFRALRYEEQDLLREGLSQEFDVRRWKEAMQHLEDAEPGTESLAALYESEDPVQAQEPTSLGSLGDLGFSVREV